ncbi:Allantoinase [Salmonella enterica subsp. enterica]|uniref:Allantoinase n=1 Tax=Salmonella enterica I TaxID=59201 RepID=A0A447U8D9_SALET|nr:Allantoinase [Salmonella enterica subsp. enterica]
MKRCKNAVMSLPMFGKLMATNAADIFGLKHKGRIAPGKDADLVFIQPDSSYVLKNEDLEYRHKVSPYVWPYYWRAYYQNDFARRCYL